MSFSAKQNDEGELYPVAVMTAIPDSQYGLQVLWEAMLSCASYG